MAACKPRGGEDEAAVQSAPEFALEPDVQRRRLRAYQAIGLPVLLTYTITNAFTGHTVFLLIHSFTLLLMGLSWWMLRCGRCVVKATHTFLASVLFLTTCGPLFEDLFDSQTLWFLPAIPLAAAFILGRRVAYHYLAAATLSLSTVFAIDFFYFPISSDAYVRFDWAILRCVHLAVFSTFAVINHRDTAHRVGELEAKRDLMNKALDEAEAANRSKSVFLANMSHEIRNPMNGILGTTEYLRNSKLDAADQEALDTIARCGEHLSALIDDILDLSRIETGELGIEHDPFNLRELVEHTVALFGPKAQSAGVQLRVDLPASPPRLLGDKKRLSQVLSNLIGNAIKFSDQGSVSVQAKLFNAEAERHRLELSVIDEGIGMKPEQLARLFGEFEQVDDSEGIERGGSGLGLAISRHLIQRMGGDIEVQSRFGHGSTFTISLQLEASIFASPMALLPLDQLQSSPPVCKEYPVRALVVDDQPINLKLASLLLEKLGCEVKQAADGREAIDHCETNQFDIIFMDIRMPILSGLEAAMLITQTPGINQHTPIVALTACAFDEDRQASLEAGMLDHLPKPLRRAQLEQALKTFVSPRSQEQLRKASE